MKTLMKDGVWLTLSKHKLTKNYNIKHWEGKVDATN